MLGASNTLFDLGIGPAGGVLTMNDISLSAGHYPFFQDTGSAVIDGMWVEQSTGTEIGAVFKGQANSSRYSIIRSSVRKPIRDESPCLAFVNMGNVVVNGGVIETSNGARTRRGAWRNKHRLHGRELFLDGRRTHAACFACTRRRRTRCN